MSMETNVSTSETQRHVETVCANGIRKCALKSSFVIYAWILPIELILAKIVLLRKSINEESIDQANVLSAIYIELSNWRQKS